MKLHETMICIDCDELYSASVKSLGPGCPACGSMAAAALWTWLPAMRASSLRLWLERMNKNEARRHDETSAQG